MPFFSRRFSLDDALALIREELAARPGTLPSELRELLGALRRRDDGSGLAGDARTPAEDVLEAMPDAAAIVEGNGRFVARNQLFNHLLGPSRASVIEATRSGDVADLVQRALEGWPARRELDLPGLSLRVLAIAAPLGGGSALLLLRDLTAQRRAEAVRRDFIANASHELRTPVTAISGAAETLLHGGLSLDDQSRHFVEMIARHATRLSRLAQDLLDLSRLESGEWKPELGPIDVASVSATTLDLFRPRAEEKRIVLASDVPNWLKATADRRALEQVLTNLLDNAVKYTPEGGRVTLLGDGLGQQVMLSVVDTGPGIEPRHQARIFDGFYRVDPGRSRELGGTGLGLAIVKHLAQAMGGEAGVESGRGGSRFWVRLPAA